MQNINTIYILCGAIGLLLAILIAEVGWRKSMHQANHVVPTAIIKNANKIVWQKAFYYGFFLTIIFTEKVIGVKVPEPVYWLDGFAIVGGDVQKLANKFFRLR